ncbi:hypothetical protein [Planctomicrobium sp. SH527]|uniref:hypothetical protein n=1 Tax=Planctomicrobium sp. SH527 TaxID=3448123 RepID=UPI003F5B2500
MSRKHREDHEFGSDSFLDVLANLVGILIILIVAVGVRVANTSPEELLNSQTEQSQDQVASIPELVAPEPEIATPVMTPPRELPPIPVFAPIPTVQPTDEMLRRAEELKRNYDALQSQLAELQVNENQLKKIHQDRAVEVATLRQQVTKQTGQLENEKSQLSILELDVATLRNQVMDLKRQADEIDLDAPPVEKLVHQMTPIGRVVAGDEVHFRLSGNRVTYVPVTELVREVQLDLERRKDILLNKSFFQGNTRTIEGYMMEYVMQRQGGTLSDDMRYGRSMIRIGISSWVIKPVGSLRGEMADEALQSGSLFRTAIGKHGPTATVTFWVYPDSFELHQKLKAFTHEAGYWVASRPLPLGVPIAGSPHGSKSVAQ